MAAPGSALPCAYIPDKLIALDIELLPGLSVPWVCEFSSYRAEPVTLGTFRESLVKLLASLGEDKQPEPPQIQQQQSEVWGRQGDTIVISDSSNTTCTPGLCLPATGYTIRVPLARMLEIVKQAIGLVADPKPKIPKWAVSTLDPREQSAAVAFVETMATMNAQMGIVAAPGAYAGIATTESHVGGEAETKIDARAPILDADLSIYVLATGDGNDQVLMLTATSGGIVAEWELDGALAASRGPNAWDRLLNHDGDCIGSSSYLSDAWITRYLDADNSVMYEIRPRPVLAGMTLHVPGRLLLPKLRPAIAELFRRLAATDEAARTAPIKLQSQCVD
jgi:hypothetical protein